MVLGLRIGDPQPTESLLKSSGYQVEECWAGRILWVQASARQPQAKVCFAGAWFGCWVYGSGCFAGDMGLRFGYLLEIDYGENTRVEHKEHEHVLLKK